MQNLILGLGITSYSMLVLTLIGLLLFRLKKKRIFYKMHRALGIVTLILASTHGFLALYYYLG